jgi:hypothetical protein
MRRDGDRLCCDSSSADVPGAKLPIAVLPTPDGTLIGKAEKKEWVSAVYEAEKLVDEEIQAAGESVDSQPKDAKGHVIRRQCRSDSVLQGGA